MDDIFEKYWKNFDIKLYEKLKTLKFSQNEKLILEDKNIWIEIISILNFSGNSKGFKFLSKLKNKDDLYFNQESMKEGFTYLLRDIVVEQTEIKTSKDLGECFKCHKKKLISRTSQKRSGDEPLVTFYQCLNCRNSWVN